MQVSKRLMIIGLLIIAGILLTGCAEQEASAVLEHDNPAWVEAVEGEEFNHVILLEQAAVRLGIETGSVREETIDGADRLVIPYSAVIYGLNGETWTYVNPEPLTFMRAPITIDYIEDDMVVLSDGPSAGTEIATVGLAELYGIDTGVGK